MARRWYLACYDIAEPKRLRRTHHLLCDWGFPVNYSVFLVEARRDEIDRLVTQLERLIDDAFDDIRIYALPRHAEILAIGWKRPAVFDGAGYVERLLADPVRAIYT